MFLTQSFSQKSRDIFWRLKRRWLEIKLPLPTYALSGYTDQRW